MDSDHFLLTYPAFLIGQPPEPGKPEQIAVRMLDGRPALPIFTETIHAERFMDGENVSGGIIVIPGPKHLAGLIRRYRDQLELVLIDPNPANNRGLVFPVAQFLSELES